MDQRRAETSGPEVASLLARQPWARVSRELALYARRVGPEAGTASAARRIAWGATARACNPFAPAWNFREQNLWSLLTGLVDELLAEEGERDAARVAASAAEIERIPLLDNEQLDAELSANGLDPGELARDGARLRSELQARIAGPRATLRPRRSELPSLSATGWLAIVGVVFATVLIAALAVLWARR